ncbi:MAG: hypothetical protein JXQ72_01965 [Anaerolineae bacterium]|nr:hypothetical protein [Anaerolineae bacterium]
MIPAKRVIFLFVFLTIGLLVACEPLAPDQSPHFVVVTGETPDITGAAVVSPLATGTPISGGVTNTGGVVNTPPPTEMPIPIPTTFPTATPFVCSQTEGSVIRSFFTSAITGEEFAYRVYLPPCFYETLRRYPYVILLHGTGFDDAMWDSDLGAPLMMDKGITSGALPPMVLVMPDGGLISEFNDQPDGTSYESVILDELIPRLEADFCLWGNRDGRAIGGISRGGFWAFSMVFRHPELFSAVGGHSPHFEPDNALPQNNPLDLAANASLSKLPMRIYIDHSAGDYVGTYAKVLSDTLRDRGITHEYLINATGDHTVEYWRAQVPEYLSFYGGVWPLDPLVLPSCLEPSPE